MRTAVQETASQIAEKQFQRCRGKGQDGYDFGKLRVLTTREFPGTEFQFGMMKKFRRCMMVMVE